MFGRRYSPSELLVVVSRFFKSFRDIDSRLFDMSIDTIFKLSLFCFRCHSLSRIFLLDGVVLQIMEHFPMKSPRLVRKRQHCTSKPMDGECHP